MIAPLITVARRLKLSSPGIEAQRLYWAMGALGIALLPHVRQIPVWIVPVLVAASAWRMYIESRGASLPPRWFRLIIAFATLTSVAVTFRTLNGLDAGTALLCAMAGVKLLESRGIRDCTMLIFIGYVLIFAALLYDQSLMRLPYILFATWALTIALLRVHASDVLTVRTGIRTTLAMLLQALPVAVLLFLFFPRLPGQFWALPTRSSAASGLSDEMTPGDISMLTLSGEVAFRVAFDGPIPPPAERYWRGPVLHEFDGRSWRRDPARFVRPQDIETSGTQYSYRITLEPTQRAWVYALDIPTQWPEGTIRLFDMQLVAQRPITTLSSFTLTSHTNYRTPATLSRNAVSVDTRLPDNNPRTRAFATQLRATVASDRDYVRAILQKFRQEEFYYTLSPPLLGTDPVDQFLFETKRGFCEHFASAFTTLMRAANIPARVVTGYQGGEYNNLGEYLLVRQSDAHAWSEVWLKDEGWVRVDPTAAVAPSRVEKNLDAAISDREFVPGRFLRSSTLLTRARLTWDAVNNFWNNRIVEYNEAKQKSLMALLGVKNVDYQSLGIAIALTLGGFFLFLTLYLGWKYRPARRDALVVVYDSLCRKLSRAQIHRDPHEPPTAYLTRAAEALPQLTDELTEARTLYNDLRYGPNPTAAELSRFKYIVNRLRVR